MSVFIVKVRNPQTCMWGNEAEVVADTAKEAAELAAESPLTDERGLRADLRVRVWPTPFGTQPDIAFYVRASAPPAAASQG